MTYHHLLESFEGSRTCALCSLEEGAMRRYFDSILYESVTDPAIRAELRTAHGYCSVHAHYLVSLRAAFDTAILYQDEIEDMITLSDRLLEGRAPKQSLAQKLKGRGPDEEIEPAWLRHDRCPACRIHEETQGRYVGALVDSLEEEEMRKAFSNGSGVCLPHLRLLLKRTRGEETRRLILDRQKRILVGLRGELAELCRKFDYRFTDEKVGEERDSWRRAVLLVNGSPLSFPR